MTHWLCLTVVMLFPITAFAETKEFIRDYTYVAGEADSKISARQMAMQEVKRELLNELGTHIYSRIDMSENSKGEADAKQEIRTMTAGFVKVDVLEENWNGYEFYIKAKMAADPKEILNRIKDLASSDEENLMLKDQLNQSLKAFEELRLEMLALQQALGESKSVNEKQSIALKYAQRSKELAASELYEKGQDLYWGYKGNPIDYHEAFTWFQKAADKGNAGAQNMLAISYDEGKGVEKNYKQSIYWFQKAADQGNANAQANLANKYLIGISVKGDYEQAAYWYQKAADQGKAHSQHMLGVLYDSGNGVQQNFKKAVYWFQKAADQSNAIAQYYLGSKYYKGEGVQKDFKKSAYWFRKSAEQGNADAQYNLAFKYYKGEGVQENFWTALYWFNKAADQGHVEAKRVLGVLVKK